MEFRLLGQVEMWHGDRCVDLGHAKQRLVLAVLLMEAGQIVAATTLLDRVWGHAPPDAALSVLYGYVARLRKALASCGVSLAKDSGGYVLDIDADAVDVHRFRRLLAEAANAGNPELAAARFDEALALWRGAPFSSAGSPWFATLRKTLEEQHLSAVLDRNEAYLRQGRVAELARPLLELTAANPLDERPAAQLMRVLYRSGRAAEALEQYQLARNRLADQGTEPSPFLRELHQRILRGDPSLIDPDGQARGRLPVPAGLPHDVPGFVGRGSEIKALDALVPEVNTRRTVVISAVDGTAGVGKTALAVHWAHRVKARFPDGNLYADLHGFGPGPTADPGQVLDGFLMALEVAPGKIPSDLDAKAALYRSLLDERHMLLVLDNAATPEQVRPLLPGSPGCLVVVTSRNMLTGLAVRNRAHRISLNVLPAGDAVALLEEFVGAARIAAEPEAAGELARLCAYLPVALCVAGEHAAARPGIPLAQLVMQLGTASKLDLLDAGGDTETAVRAVFSWSYRALPAAAARLFRLLGLHPGHDLATPGAAVTAGLDLEEAQRLLDILVRAHLVQRAVPGRYSMHDLLRAYAVERCGEEEPERQAALARLIDYFVHTARSAADTAYPGVLKLPQDHLASAFDDSGQAFAWLEEERANLVAVVVHTARHGPPAAAWRLADSLRGFFHLRHGGTDWLTTAHAGLSAACDKAEPHAQAFMHLSAGLAQWLSGRMQQAVDDFTRALACYRQVGNQEGEAAVLNNLGGVLAELGQLGDALDCRRQALQLRRRSGPPGRQAMALIGLATVLWEQGNLASALEHLRQALELERQMSDRIGEAIALNNMALVLVDLGQPQEALACLKTALPAIRDAGDQFGETAAWENLAKAHHAMAEYAQACECAQKSLMLANAIGDVRTEADAHGTLASAHLGTGRPDEARSHYHQGLQLARQTGYVRGEIVALLGLAAAQHDPSEPGQALDHAQQALALARASGLPVLTGQALTLLAQLTYHTGDHAQAAQYCQEALALHRETGHAPGITRTLSICPAPLDASAGQSRPTKGRRGLP